MLKKTITYTDYNGEKQTENFYFNLNKAEVVEFNMAFVGGLENTLELITNTRDTKKVMEMFREIILKSYGVKSADGRRFIKSKELSEEFAQTEAYSELVMEILTKPNYATEFISGVIPQDVVEEMGKNPALPNT